MMAFSDLNPEYHGTLVRFNLNNKEKSKEHKPMKELTTMTNDGTITSKDLCGTINMYREQIEGKSDLMHYDLLKIIRDEFDEEIGEGNISVSSYTSSQNKKMPMYNLTHDQAKQVLVRESKHVRKAVIKYISELESKLLPSYQIINPVERARAWANEYETHVKEIEHKNKEIEYKDDTIIALTEDIDLEMKQKRISEIVKCKSPQQDRFRLLYIEFRNKYNIDIRKRYKNAVDKGTIKKYKTSKLQYACNTLNLTDLLFRFTVKLFETDAKEIYGRIVDVL